jgi:hypothetical protein
MNAARLLQLALMGFPGLFLCSYGSGFCYFEPDSDLINAALVSTVVVLHAVHGQVKELPSIPRLLSANLLLIMLLPVVFPGRCCHCGGALTWYKSNLKNLATALEMYSTDNAGHYPASLSQVTPNYLKFIPQCPAAGKVTYRYARAEHPEAYTVWCGGCWLHYSGIDAPDYPQYRSSEGLRSTP